jgi:hypothetical protein
MQIMTGKLRGIQRQIILGTHEPFVEILISLSFDSRAIVRTLNTNYSSLPFGLGGASTIYPASAFVTDVVYIKGTTIEVDETKITVSLALLLMYMELMCNQSMGVKCREVEISGGSRFNADTADFAMRQAWLDSLASEWCNVHSHECGLGYSVGPPVPFIMNPSPSPASLVYISRFLVHQICHHVTAFYRSRSCKYMPI